MGAKAFMCITKKGDAFLIYTLPITHVGRQQHDILFNTNVTRMCLKRRMLTHYQKIDHMVAQLIWKKVCSPHLDPSTIYHKMNL
jgi:DNA-directed RNA polymerase subunit N (RpoN/RPB10)